MFVLPTYCEILSVFLEGENLVSLGAKLYGVEDLFLSLDSESMLDGAQGTI